ncbi:NtaA/DmoA family FMN-dependent monooxygenase [Streptomyces sp. NPDC026672]|uniref:NtaA/DmoA family FMN-dependent monooxygenase n=1 Tax=unclassified Streptomyces TaxID=2593676 RepID=UPI0033E9A183
MTVRRRLHLAARLPGAGGGAVWAGQGPGAQIEFSSFERLARTAERGLFDFVLATEGLRPREHRGLIDESAVAGRPDPFTVLHALAAVTGRLGLAATADTAFHQPYDLARRLATLDHLSGGRAAWNVVVSDDARTRANFRYGGAHGRADRHARAVESVAVARELWDSRPPDGAPRAVAHRGPHFDVAGAFGLPRPPQGHPVLIRSGDSAEGREFAAATADVLCTRPGPPGAGRALCADVRRRLVRHGRAPDEVKVMPGVLVCLGDTAAEAHEREAEIRRRQVSPRGAIVALERVWGTDLSGYDPDGPLPETDPEPGADRDPERYGDAVALAEKWRALSREKGLSIWQTVIEARAGRCLTGTPEAVAGTLDTLVRDGAADGFVLLPHHIPGGLDEFVDRVVPLLQERGAFRTEYEGATLRSHLGLSAPARKGPTT